MGYLDEDPERLDVAALGSVVGPTVHFNSFTSDTGEWKGSVQISCKDQLIEGLALSYSVGSGPVLQVPGQQVLIFQDWIVVRFPIMATLTSEPQALKYVIQLPKVTLNPEGVIQLPCRDKSWRLVGYSCNDQRQERKVGTACWQKFVDLHRESPVHVLLGTGDQLYNDNIWTQPLIKEWLSIQPKNKRCEVPATPAQQQEIDGFYFFSYLRFVHFHPMGRAVLAGMPQANTWDDHDIFDGWGSYPDYLQGCSMFQTVFLAAKRMYMAFQLHTNDQLANGDGYFGAPGLSWATQMGPELVVAAPDTRSERTIKTIYPQSRITELLARVQAMPSRVRHLLFISAVPVAYPEVVVVAGGLGLAKALSPLLVKTGVMNALMNEFGEVELLDDVTDHWSSNSHSKEKSFLLQQLAAFAKARSMRVTLLSGDVHQCAVACVQSKSGGLQAADPTFMVQLISSAIGYEPPSDNVVKGIEFHVKKGPRDVTPGVMPDVALVETIGYLFREAPPGTSRRFGNSNNFVELVVTQQKGAPCLACNIWVRGKNTPSVASSVRPRLLMVPPVMPPGELKACEELEMEYFVSEPVTVRSACCLCL